MLVRVDGAKEVEGLVIAAKQRVLAVVDDLTALRVRKRGGPAAEPSALLDDEHTRAGLDQPHRRAEAGKAGADDDRRQAGT